MSEHRASIEWRGNGVFDQAHYSRAHTMRFDGGIELAGNAAAGNIPATVPAAIGVDPEQAFVASLSACHMLWFLALAYKAGWTVEHYIDDASGVLDRNEAGKIAMTRVTLRPNATFGAPASLGRAGSRPAPRRTRTLFHRQFGHHASIDRSSIEKNLNKIQRADVDIGICP